MNLLQVSDHGKYLYLKLHRRCPSADLREPIQVAGIRSRVRPVSELQLQPGPASDSRRYFQPANVSEKLHVLKETELAGDDNEVLGHG